MSKQTKKRAVGGNRHSVPKHHCIKPEGGMSRRNKKPSRNLFFRELKSVPFTENILPDEFKQFFEQEIWFRLKLLHTGYKTAEKKMLAAQVVHNLIETGLTYKVVADSRNYNDRAARRRIPIWDILVEKKLCKLCKGSEVARQVTRYRATSGLLELREIWELKLLRDLNLKWNTQESEPTSHALVVLYSGKTDWLTGETLPDEKQKKPQSILKRIEATAQRSRSDYRKSDPQAVQHGFDYFRQVENLINDINTENLLHSWIAYTISPETGNTVAFQPNVCLRQIHSGDLFRATRLYSWGALSGQGMSKEQRQTIHIDGEQAGEIDSHCHSIRMLYHFRGIDGRGDLYYPERIFRRYYDYENASDSKKTTVRGFVKRCTNICLNTPSADKALKGISKALRDHEHYKFLRNLIFGIESTNLNGLLNRLIEAHPRRVSDCFFSDVGLDLMTADGMIMLWVLAEFVKRGRRPALAIHDSLVVRRSDVDDAVQVFSKSYYQFIRFTPVLKRKF
jgi:hypothetical protein